MGGYNYGRVEVCGSGIWGTVCIDDYWDDVDAGVICKQMGFSFYGEFYSHIMIMQLQLKHHRIKHYVLILISTGSFSLSSWFTEYDKIALLHSVECNGTEESIFDCRTNEGDGGCLSYQDGSVICQGIPRFMTLLHNLIIFIGLLL